MGDVGTGKTRMTAELLEEAVELGFSGDVTVIDMAPETREIEGRRIGGRISDITEAYKRVRFLTPYRVEPPRLTATSAEELLSLVQLNAQRIKPLIEEYLAAPSPILFVNDISLYFQSGSFNLILRLVEEAETFIANGYYGEYFAEDLETGVSKRERELIDLLASQMDIAVRL